MKGNINMGQNITITLDDATIDAIGAAIAQHLKVDVAVVGDGDAPAAAEPKAAAKKSAAKRPAKKAAAKAEPEPEVEDDADDSAGDREAELRGMTVAALRKVAVGLGFDKDEVKGADKDTLVDAILEDEAENADEDAEDEDDETDESEADEDDDADDDEDEDDEEDEEESDDDAESDEYTRDDLEAMSLRELKALAKEWEVDVPKGIDQDDLIDLMLGDADDEDDDSEDDEDGDDDTYSEDDLKAMSIGDLRDLAKEWEVTVPKNAKKPGIIKALLGE